MSPDTFTMDLTKLDSSISIDNGDAVVNVQDVTRLTAQASAVGGAAWATAVISFEGTIDGRTTWFSLATLSADGITAALDVTQYALVRARVSTAGTGTVAVSMLRKKI